MHLDLRPHSQYRRHIGQAREQPPLDRETRERLRVCGAVIAHASVLHDQRIVATLAGCDWVRNAQNLILTGPTGAGKTWLACAFELKIAHGDGSFMRQLAQLAKIDVLILDDWGLQDLDQAARNDLLEVLDDRVGTRSTVITSQLPLEHWHAWLQDPTLADAILDRLVHQAHKLPVKGDSMRKKAKSKSADV